MKAWYWLLYPLGVTVVILVSASVLFGNAGMWNKLTARQDQLKQQSTAAAQLQTKLSRLQSADLATEHRNLDYLWQVLPANKNLPALLNQIQLAASASAAVFEGFSGQVGEVTASESAAATPDNLELKVIFKVTDMGQLQQAISALETSLPIVKVNGVDLIGGKATLIVEGLWKPLAKLPAGAQYPISDVRGGISELRDQLKNYTSLSASGGGPDTLGVNPNPF